MNNFKLTQIGCVIALILYIGLGIGCEQYKELTNDPPKVTNFTVPAEVAYGETVVFRIRVFDPEEDPLTYSWEVSHGSFVGAAGVAEVQWKAPELPDEEVAPPIAVTVNIAVSDGGDEEIYRTAEVIVFSKPYKVARSLSGTYTFVSKEVHGEPVAEAGNMRLTPTTFTREFQQAQDGEAQGLSRFLSGSYKLIEPFDERKGTIHWYADADPVPSESTYTWDGTLLVLFWSNVSTRYVYKMISRGSEELPIQDAGTNPEPINTNREPGNVVGGDVNPEPVNADGKPLEVTDATFQAMVLDAPLPIVVEFRADWCPFCRQMKPIVETVASENRNKFVIALLDIDNNKRIPEEYKVEGIPTYIIFQDGSVAARFAGAMPKAAFLEKILNALQ